MNKLINKVICGDSLKTLEQLPAAFIDCVVTSPPYWALRDYGVDGQLGLEETQDNYIVRLCNIFDGVRRVLKETGTCWVNIGDTYGGSKSALMIPFRFSIEMVNRGWILRNTIIWHKPNCMPSSVKDRFTVDFEYMFFFVKSKKYWFERQFEPVLSMPTPRRLIKGKSNGKEIGSAYGRVCGTKSTGRNKRCVWKIDHSRNGRTEYLLSQLYDIKQTLRGKHSYKGKSHNIKGWNETLNNAKAYREGFKVLQQREHLSSHEVDFLKDYVQNHFGNPEGRNKRCVWTITTKPFKEAHFAVYPEELVKTPIKAGCPEFICRKCGKAKNRKYEGKSSTAFNIRVRDVKEGRIKHKDRKASSNEVQVYQEKKYGGNGRKLVGYTDCGCNAGFKPGIVLDPFSGSGTTLLAAKKLGRDYLGIDLNPEYVEMSKRRIGSDNK